MFKCSCKLIFTFISILTLYAAGTPSITSSKIEKCNADDKPKGCAKKLIITFTLDTVGTELYPSSAEDNTNGGATVDFPSLRIMASRSAVRFRYPIVYGREYNAKPYEEIIGGTVLKKCSAEFDASKATCGVAKDVNGVDIPYSQGFCCDCGVCKTASLCPADCRSTNVCNEYNGFASASCLRFGSRWYSGYSIGERSFWYDMNISISKKTETGSSSMETIAILALNPDSATASSSDSAIQGQLTGDVSPFEQPQDFSSRMLFMPSTPTSDDRVKAGPKEWIILDSILVTPDGRACDRVGVSYEAFATQGSGTCMLNSGTCLRAQLEDYRAADIQNVADGKKAEYMATAFGNFEQRSFKSNTSSDMLPYIAYRASTPVTTTVTLTISADDLHYYSTGVIVSTSVTGEPLTINTQNGAIKVTVQNTGPVASSFTVGISFCSVNTTPIPERVATILAGIAHNFVIPISLTGVDHNASEACRVYLRNSADDMDSKVVYFNVATVEAVDSGSGSNDGGNSGSGGSNSHGGEGPGGSTEESAKGSGEGSSEGPSTGSDGSGGGTSSDSDEDKCKPCGFMNFSCSFTNKCTAKIAGNIIFLVGIVCVIVLLIVFRKYIFCCRKCRRESSSFKRNGGQTEMLPFGNSMVPRQLTATTMMQGQPPPPPDAPGSPVSDALPIYVGDHMDFDYDGSDGLINSRTENSLRSSNYNYPF